MLVNSPSLIWLSSWFQCSKTLIFNTLYFISKSINSAFCIFWSSLLNASSINHLVLSLQYCFAAQYNLSIWQHSKKCLWLGEASLRQTSCRPLTSGTIELLRVRQPDWPHFDEKEYRIIPKMIISHKDKEFLFK